MIALSSRSNLSAGRNGFLPIALLGKVCFVYENISEKGSELCRGTITRPVIILRLHSYISGQKDNNLIIIIMCQLVQMSRYF